MTHPAENLTTKKKIIFTAMSWKFFAYRMFVTKYVLEQGAVPLNPFMTFDYFMLDTVERNIVREANNNLVLLAEELWCFGSISDGVMVEIGLAKKHGMKVRYFRIEKPAQFIEIFEHDMPLEDDVKMNSAS